MHNKFNTETAIHVLVEIPQRFNKETTPSETERVLLKVGDR